MGRVTLGEPRRFKSPMKKSKTTRDLKQKLRDVQSLYGDGSTPKRPKSRKTKTPKGRISVQETANPGQAPQAEMAQKPSMPLPPEQVPKKVHTAKFSPNVTFADILNDAATAASENDTGSASVADT
eukprot:SAG11_NODE_11268_length_771_cov_93.938988_1_plen_125_part_10